MESSAKASQSGSDNDKIVTNVNRLAIDDRRRSYDTRSSVSLGLALGVGYSMGSMSTAALTSTPTSTSVLSLVSIGKTAWAVITILEEWVRDVIVTIYTLSVLLYLSMRLYDDWKNDKKSNPSLDSKPQAVVSSSFSLSIRSLPPLLRRLSTSTLPVDEEKASTESLRRPPPSSARPAEQIEEEDEAQEGEKPIDMTGTFTVVENDNFGEFLKAQGVPWFLCNAASKARPTHNFLHLSPDKLTIQIRGIIDSETSYKIGGPYTETSIRGRVFQDSLSYLYDEIPEAAKANDLESICVGVQTRKVAVGEGYEVHVERRIVRAGATWVPTSETNPDGHSTYDLDKPCDFDRLHMANKIVYKGESGREPVIASQLFHRTD
mmetsp:Transcript_17143/g.39584  ORF Transcript_17143/g.39584 Transcript_17143/m.39584 type:complete len:377 (-) Transcript_17143:207-1337(-)